MNAETIKKDGQTFYLRQYSGLDEILELSQAKPIAKLRKRSSRKPERDGGWYGSPNFTSVLKLAATGNPYPEIQTLWSSISKRLPSKDYAMRNDLAGYAPDVVSFIAGRPDNMYKRKMVYNERKQYIKIIFDVCLSSAFSPEFFNKRGMAFLSILASLENLGYIVDVDISTSIAENRDNGASVLSYIVPIKSAQYHLDLNRSAFLLCHASYLRRIIFSAMETESEDIVNMFNVGGSYGYPYESIERLPIANGALTISGVMLGKVPNNAEGISKWLCDTLRAQGMATIADEILRSIQ